MNRRSKRVLLLIAHCVSQTDDVDTIQRLNDMSIIVLKNYDHPTPDAIRMLDVVGKMAMTGFPDAFADRIKDLWGDHTVTCEDIAALLL